MNLIKLILTVGLLSIFINGQSQNIDTLIADIRYTIIQDTTSEMVAYEFTIQNHSKNSFETSQFGINSNKLIPHNSLYEKIRYDFIVCGNFKRIVIQPDSSYTWRSKIIELIPDTFQGIGNNLIRRDKFYEFIDSLYIQLF